MQSDHRNITIRLCRSRQIPPLSYTPGYPYPIPNEYQRRVGTGRPRGDTLKVKAQKRRAPSDSEHLEHLKKRLRHTSNFCQLVKAKEDWKCLAQLDDERGDEDASFVKKMRLSMSGEFGRSDGDLIVPGACRDILVI